MNIRPLITSCGAVLMVAFAGAGLWATSVVPASATEFQQTNLVSDVPGKAKTFDPNVVNAWGISEGNASFPTPFWISDNGTGFTSVYSVPDATLHLTVTIPPATGATTSAPTGQVFNDTSGFDLKNGGGKALFLFTSEDGAISGWNMAAGTTAVRMVDNGNTDPLKNSVYKGLAISDENGGTLFATNFRFGRIDAFDKSFNPTMSGDFVDSALPAGYAPFNDKVVGNDLYVTYALQDSARHDDVKGDGHGFVDVFNLTTGMLDPNFGIGKNGRLISQGKLNSPWGLAIAPAGFGPFGGDLLVGNFGDGRINAYNATTGAFVDALKGTDGNPLMIEGLWGLSFGNGSAVGGSLNTLYFTAGPGFGGDVESHGLFGSLTAVPEPSTWAMLLIGFGGLGIAAMWHRRASFAAA
jgi:uncharacterized protein (TIGR03118 family)